MTDFLEEIEEQLRSDRYKALALKVWPWILGVAVAALVLALAWWGLQSYRSRLAAKSSETYAAALDLYRSGQIDKAYAGFGEAVKTSSGGYKSLALMQQGAIRLQQGETSQAADLFDKAAAAAPSPIIGDMARLKSAFALIDTATFAVIEQRLKPLTDAKRPYRAAALEALAMAKLRAGRLKEARDDFVVLSLLSDAPDAVRQRAQAALSAIDSGAAAGVPAAVEAARRMPPPPPVIPGLSSSLPQSGAAQ